ncbi:putative cation-transporting ATPase 13A3 [Schistosoma japonicum]|nr:putative cation-transporting ATPase 13A3 [Schistosoma japonicum]
MKKKECVQEDNCQKISEPDDTLVEITGYSLSRLRTILVYAGIVLTCGLLRLVFHWFPHWMLMCMNKKCSLMEAEKILVKDAYGVHYIHDVIVDITKGNNDCPEISYVRKSVSFMRSKITYLEDDSKIICYFMHKCLKYVWDCETNRFELLRGWHETSYAEILNSKPLNNETVNIRRALYGINEISINVTPVVKMLLEECLNPFYCFQIFSCILWYSDEYWMYATCIVVISVTSLAWQVYELRRNEQTLKETMCTSSSVIVCREDGVKVFKEVDSVSLVPGDIIEIPHNGCLLQCDAVLLAGSCIVNESTLTGESVPVTKIPLPDSPTKNSLFDIKLHGRYILFSGTTVIQTRNYADERVLAVVARTGFYTVKGELVRSILYPKPLKFKFTQDSFRFIFALSILAVIGLGVSIYLMIRAGVSTGGIIKRALDLITVVVPPALPVVMTVGAVLAQRRLRSHGIFCVNPNVINVCGVIDVACFDKTGTLTEDGLDMWGIIPYEDGIFKDPELEPSKLDNGPLKECLATCHSLTLIEGTLSGDPLDLKMFQSTKWEFIEEAADHCKFEMAVPAIVRPSKNNFDDQIQGKLDNDEIPYEVGILRQFPFSSSLQRMSVITRALNQNHFSIYSKGAPETIELLCRCDTIPRDFHSTLLEYTREGYRVLALAWKPLKATYAKVVRVSRERVEQDLRFLGLLIMENRLKPETTQVIQTLRYANIRPVMVTGDNMLTALSVARDCEMIDELDRIILVSAKPPASHSSSPCDSSTCDVSSRLKDQQSNVASSQHFSVNLPPTLPATKTPGKTTRSRIYSSFNTPNSVSQENVFAQQDDSLVEFHYAEDLHKPVTEVTATIKTGTTGSHRRSQPGLHTADDEGLREFSLKDAKKSRKFTRRLYTDIPCVCENNSSSSLSPLTNIPQVCNVTMNNQPHVSSSTEQNHHHYQSVNDTSIKNHSKSISNRRLVFTRPVSIRMLDRPDFHLAMSGKTWGIIREYYPWLIPKLVVKGTVFARFHPEQKAQLIESLQSVGYFVSMCGDGANDCGALKVAHAGIALSEAEASVASPFTSKQQNISCVPTLIREGRCALTTSFGAFKFMVGYSMIQFFSVILLYYIGSNLSDLQFLFIDLFLITTLGLTFGYTPAYPRLSVEPPGMRLVSTVTLLSLSLQLLTCAIVQFSVFVFTRAQPWYLPLFTYDEDYELKNYESTAIFTVSVYQYVILAIVFSKSAPYRKSILHNHLFMINIVACIAASLYLTIHPARVIRQIFELCSLPSVYFLIILHGIAFGNLLFGYILESIVDGVSFRQRIRHIHRALFPRHISRKDYEHIRDEIDRLAGIWPPIIRSASVQALPKELFNESDVVTQISQTSRKRYNSRLSTDSEEDDNYISAASKEKAVLCNGLLDSTVHKQAQSHFNQSQFQPHFVVDTTSKGAIEKSAHKKRTRSTSRRHSFSTSLGKDGVKHGTSKESTPKQQTPTDHQMPRLDVLTPIGHARRFRSQSGPRPFYRNSIDFHSATKC